MLMHSLSLHQKDILPQHTFQKSLPSIYGPPHLTRLNFIVHIRQRLSMILRPQGIILLPLVDSPKLRFRVLHIGIQPLPAPQL